jgi:myo-inositol 2-dehydrogenase / D-chiro-inositol 1-dehydrogenase
MTDHSRRDFMKTTTAAAVGTGLAGWGLVPGAYAQGSDEIRIGLIGAGGRGTGAVADVFKGHEQGGIRLVAIGDVFADRVDASRKRLAEQYGAAATVRDDHAFSGFDAYQKVIASDVNYIILASPPGFRPQHLEAAITAGKHVFAEKPLAVDGPGIRKVLALAEVATSKGLCIVSM